MCHEDLRHEGERAAAILRVVPAHEALDPSARTGCVGDCGKAPNRVAGLAIQRLNQKARLSGVAGAAWATVEG